ncbi:thymidine phosphorylase [Aliiroseovarius lamellibrachiae]|uniref:thymidine phosphorylase n=1 Tax=Aliiroseovarius lamellibrachiae TaxID=1924933 RepID=UPI001BE056B4|nr:thymidine phosphorylase [Aliiroseovarius lamellibrachiae]MBT2131556.1 thymidine phosphorylase [Aliiroseovarius lamellibrachiae]
MLIAEIIRQKRDGAELSPQEISAMVAGISDNSASEGQVAAFAMAVFFQGMTRAEATNLTCEMRDSGDVFNWSDLPGPVVDKHSTGGVGDNVSLMLAPIVAACGGYVPMISGRGLGHTGGTLDKMEAIPGYTVTPDNDLFAKVVAEVGCAVIGQTANLAPADKRFYGIRDVTATVESIPLITASILSKKLSAGLQSLVMDVKFGNGAFMSSFDEAEKLARSITGVARAANLPCHALLTDMNQPLASAAGNAVEVRNAVEFLTGAHRDPRLELVTVALSGEMLLTAGLYSDRKHAVAAAQAALDTGAAAEKFGQMVTALGGPSDLIERMDQILPSAKLTLAVEAPEAGQISAISTREIGLAVVELGGGRRRADDIVNPSVGLTGLLDVGVSVSKGDPIAMIHADDQTSAETAKAQVLAAYTFGGAVEVEAPVRLIVDS